MKTANSNFEDRKKSIGVAVLLVLIPMLFAILGTTLVTQVEKVDAERMRELERQVDTHRARFALLRQNERQFIKAIQGIDSMWNSYRQLHRRAISMRDSLESGNITSKIEEQDKKINAKLNQMVATSQDSLFKDIQLLFVSKYRDLINNYEQLAKDKIALHDCLAGSGLDMDCVGSLENCEAKNAELARQLRNGENCRRLELDLQEKNNQLNSLRLQLNRALDQKEELQGQKKRLEVGYEKICEQAKTDLSALKDINGGLSINCNKKELTEKINESIRAINEGVADIQTTP